jgi:hypothetical protein
MVAPAPAQSSGLRQEGCPDIFAQSPLCQRLAKVEGVGPLTATALVAAVGDGKEI